MAPVSILETDAHPDQVRGAQASTIVIRGT